ncbi:MAG: YfhO family protein, partial [Ruminococcus sp.]|nr:YfhO family protein [Ruminococcus sp.]
MLLNKNKNNKDKKKSKQTGPNIKIITNRPKSDEPVSNLKSFMTKKFYIKDVLYPLPGMRNEKKAFAFFGAYFLALLLFIPIMIAYGGYMAYYGDFNAQQIPFTFHLNEFLKTYGSLSGFDLKTDIGTDLIGSYSFYDMFSPFFLLTYIFPPKIAIYVIPWVLSLKYAVASLGAYLFIKRFVNTPSLALIGAFLYAFSGFQSYNIFFNHFHDVTAFFPFMLIALEELIQNGKKGFFAAMVGIMAVTNYFFFFGQVTFLILYFAVRWLTKQYKIDFKKFLHLALESIVGIMLAAAVLLPSYLFLSENYRISEYMFGKDYITFDENSMLFWRIIQGFFMIGDNPAWINLFDQSDGDYAWSSIGAYLPLFSCVGVLAFILNKKYNWASLLTIICVIMSLIPILNSAFYAFTDEYYARWWYMPLLIASMMTASALEQKLKLKNSFIIVFSALALFLLLTFIPIEENGATKWFGFAYNFWFFFLEWAITAGFLVLAVIAVKKYFSGKWTERALIFLTVSACFASTGVMLYNGAIRGGDYPSVFKEDMKAEYTSIPEHKNGEPFYRIEFANVGNYSMFWGYSNINSFQSSVPGGTFEFIQAVKGDKRGVNSSYPIDLYAIRGILSTKYYVVCLDTAEKLLLQLDTDNPLNEKIPGFAYLDTENGYQIFVNDFYVPMGFAYDYYTSAETIDEKTLDVKSRILTKAMVINEEQAEKYSDIIKPLPPGNIPYMKDQYLDACVELEEEACHSFSYDNKGFKASIKLEESKLVFFSIPHMKGFTATVNGKPVDIEKVNYGLMAVRGEKGD